MMNEPPVHVTTDVEALTRQVTTFFAARFAA
jgi:hypothetical protein